MRKLFLFIFVSVAITFLVGCKPSVPSEYIQPDEMEDILYDYHVAQAIAMNDAGQNSNSQLFYKEVVLKKYGVTSAEFDFSMKYYMRHTERLHTIYENLAKRLSEDAMELGANTSDINKYSALSNKGDTANIWAGNKSIVLNPASAFNKLMFKISADTTFHKGDNFMFNFSTIFMFQDGVKDGAAALSVKFDNDSVASQVIHISVSDHYQLNISGNERHNIKEISGFIFLSKGGTSLTTMKLLFLNNIQLIRFHKTKLSNAMNTGNNGSNIQGDAMMINGSGAPVHLSQTPSGRTDSSRNIIIHKRGMPLKMVK
jgi:hypothetical protein